MTDEGRAPLPSHPPACLRARRRAGASRDDRGAEAGAEAQAAAAFRRRCRRGSRGSISRRRSGSPQGSTRMPRCPSRCSALGFGFVEVGTVTPRPQAGNPKPRLFRLRRGPRGHQPPGLQQSRASRRPSSACSDCSHACTGSIGVNVGANKDSTDRIADYVAGVRAMSAGRRLPDDQHQLAQHAGAARAAGRRRARGAARGGAGGARSAKARSSSRSRPTSATAIPSGSSARRSITRSTRSSSPTRPCRGRRSSRDSRARRAACRARR